MKTIKIGLLLLLFGCLIGCGRLNLNRALDSDRSASSLVFNSTQSNLAEVATPKIIKQLNQELEQYTPQVKIISPKPKQTFNQTDVAIELDVRDLPIYKDDKLELGNHLNLIIDNEPFQEIYSTQQPIVVTGLAPGTHSIRVFAARPWGESFKNEGAYAQTTFNVLTETNDNFPDSRLPLLTYNSPTGSYGAEPLLLDFYLTNAPLHEIAQNNDNLSDWRVRATIDGTSFILSDWQPIYLTGFEPGENWIQLELIDEAGNDIENVFNNTVRVIDYNPQSTNTLSKLVTDKIALAEAKSIVARGYNLQPVSDSKIIEPSVEIEETKEAVIDRIIEVVEQPTVEDKIERQTPKGKSENENLSERPSDLNLAVNKDIQEIPPAETSRQPVIISAPAIKEVEEAIKTDRDNLTENIEAVKSTEPQQIITINEEDLDSSKPVAAIKIPEPESVEIKGNEIAITIPQIESNSLPDIEPATPVWWKKILVGLRQKLENLVRLLPNEV